MNEFIKQIQNLIIGLNLKIKSVSVNWPTAKYTQNLLYSRMIFLVINNIVVICYKMFRLNYKIKYY